MTGAEFERLVANHFQVNGFWALRIPKNEWGAQPFDILAIRGDEVWAIDCKVCGRKSFPLSRVEDNQWTAMETMINKTNARVGFIVYHDMGVYFIPYDEAKMAGTASIPLDNSHYWGESL